MVIFHFSTEILTWTAKVTYIYQKGKLVYKDYTILIPVVQSWHNTPIKAMLNGALGVAATVSNLSIKAIQGTQRYQLYEQLAVNTL